MGQVDEMAAADGGYGSLTRGYPTTYTNPEAFAVQIVAHFRNNQDWFKEAPATLEQARVIAGKYSYYMGKKKFPNTRQGRIAAAAQISKDMLGKDPTAVFSVLDNLDRYITKHGQQYPDADIVKWFYQGQQKNVGDVAANAAGKIIAAPVKVLTKTGGAVLNEVSDALPWWARPGVVIPIGIVALGGLILLEAKSGKVSQMAGVAGRNVRRVII